MISYVTNIEAIIGGDYGVAEEGESEQCKLETGKAEVAGADCEVGEREEGVPRRNNRTRRR